MKVFISWSGERSKRTAQILSSWIRRMVHSADTWMSLDIEKGVRWSEKIIQELEQTKVGIICLDKNNLLEPWILYEAGALSKTRDAHVCTFLLDVRTADVKLPLGQFQHTLFLKEDIRKLIYDINNKIMANGERGVLEKDLNYNFELLWPDLERDLNQVKAQAAGNDHTQRSIAEMLEEISQAVRMNQPKHETKLVFLDPAKDMKFPSYETWRLIKSDLTAHDYELLTTMFRIWAKGGSGEIIEKAEKG